MTVRVDFCKTLEKLHTKDKFGHFKDYVTVVEAKDTNLIVEEIHEFIKDYCMCGAENIVNRELTQLQCCDSRCVIKIAGNLEYFYKKKGFTGIGPETCLTIVQSTINQLEYKSHMDIAVMGYEDIPSSIMSGNMYNIIHANETLKKKDNDLPFAQLVASFGIPGWESNAVKYLSQYSSLSEVLADIKHMGWYGWFARKLGIQDNKLMWQFYTHIWDILAGVTKVSKTIVLSSHQDISITLSGTLRPNGIRMTKQEYMDKINGITPYVNGRKLYRFNSNKAVKTNQYIISDEFHDSAQVAVSREQLERKKILYSSAEFLDFLEAHYSTLEQEFEADNR